METLQFSEMTYWTRFGEVLDVSGLTDAEKACLKEAVDLHNKNTHCIDFIDWILRQPEIQKFFRCAVWITGAGKQSPLYRACDDMTLRLAREQRLIGLWKN